MNNYSQIKEGEANGGRKIGMELGKILGRGKEGMTSREGQVLEKRINIRRKGLSL